MDLLLDVPVQVMVEVGRARMRLREILELAPGSVVSLDKRDGEPVDLRVNGTLVARGEVVLVEDSYGIRITEILEAARALPPAGA
jgi:flagellar motor switch protein FliN/FliY